MTEYVLVPVEPTEAMTDAADSVCKKFGVHDCSAHLWDAMLAARPTPEISEDAVERALNAINISHGDWFEGPDKDDIRAALAAAYGETK